MTEPKPCPFCGELDLSISITTEGTHMCIVCKSCGACGPESEIHPTRLRGGKKGTPSIKERDAAVLRAQDYWNGRTK